jgi:hypothetical protein
MLVAAVVNKNESVRRRELRHCSLLTFWLTPISASLTHTSWRDVVTVSCCECSKLIPTKLTIFNGPSVLLTSPPGYICRLSTLFICITPERNPYDTSYTQPLFVARIRESVRGTFVAQGPADHLDICHINDICSAESAAYT